MGQTEQGRQDVIPGSAGIRMHLAQGAVRADFLLRGRPKKIFEVSPAGARFSLLGQFEKAKICLVQAKVSLGNCRLRARPSSARMHLAHPPSKIERRTQNVAISAAHNATNY